MGSDKVIKEWKVWGIRDYGKWKMIFSLSIIFLSMYLAYDMMGKTGLLIALIIFFLSLNKYIIPMTYRLYEDKIEIIGYTRFVVDPGKYKRYKLDKDGFFLATMENPSRLDNFRGVYIPFSVNMKEEDKKEIEKWLRRHF